jgi:MFS family permease
VAEQMLHLSAFDWAGISFSLLSAFFVLCGVIFLRRSRLFAYRMFERSILVSIFLSQVFAFYKEQFSALVGLLFNIIILLALRFMIEREKTAAALASEGIETAASDSLE